MLLKPKWNPKNKFCVVRVHYSVDPDKSNPEWIARAKEGISDKSWQREYEISYETFAGKAVYEDFGEHLIAETSPKPGDYVYRGWDFGYHRPAVVFAGFNHDDQFCIYDEIMGQDEGIKQFATRVKRYSQANFPGAQWLDAADPAGNQKTDKAEFTSMEVLRDLDIYPNSKPSAIDEGLEILRQRMVRRNDGLYGMIVSPKCKTLIDGFKGGYRYPEHKDGMPEKEMPLKDGFYDHTQDCTRYIAVNYLELTNVNPNRGGSSNPIMDSGGKSNSIMGGGDSLGIGEWL